MAHNIFENDSVLTVGEKPWHGLGVNLSVAPQTGREALSIAKLDWRVTKEPIFLQDGRMVHINGGAQPKTNGRYGAIVREDTQDILGVVGPGYTPLQNETIADIFDPLIADGTINIETCGSLFNGRRVWMLGKFNKGSQFVTDRHDQINRYLMLAHGHDGQLAVRFGFTYVRVVCWNTLSLAIRGKESKLIRCLHTTNLKENLEILRDGINQSDEVFELTADQYRKLANSGVSYSGLREYARRLVKADEDSNEWTSSQTKKIEKIVGLALSGKGNHGRSFWDAYNGATEYLTWEATRTSQTRFNSLWFGENSTVNKEALDLALEMAM